MRKPASFSPPSERPTAAQAPSRTVRRASVDSSRTSVMARSPERRRVRLGDSVTTGSSGRNQEMERSAAHEIGLQIAADLVAAIAPVGGDHPTRWPKDQGDGELAGLVGVLAFH